MIEAFTKIFGVLLKPAIFIFRYFAEKPTITISMAPAGSMQGTGQNPENLSLKWWTHFVLHNDSPNIIRGIKLLTTLPKGWHLKAEIPTRLEPDQKVSLPVDINVEKSRDELIQQFGANVQQNFAQLYFQFYLRSLHFEFELKNQRGRTIYQYPKFAANEVAISISSSKRKIAKSANGV